MSPFRVSTEKYSGPSMDMFRRISGCRLLLIIFLGCAGASPASGADSAVMSTFQAVVPARDTPSQKKKDKNMKMTKADHARGNRKKNHLAGEKSPYLKQHVYNPVDWYPWGEEAFSKAAKENKPIFLSIGYSTCHWCHVMEKESFTNEEIAKILNDNFVSIKVDREERPDIDKIYMTLATGAGWGGGWPLSIWMTADRKPFFGGTYFPPESKFGRPGFGEILLKIADAWKTQREKIAEDADRLTSALRRHTVITGLESELDPAWLDGLYNRFKENFNDGMGGFGQGGPKFPMPVNQNFLLRYYARTAEKKALSMVEMTLLMMSKGGMYDHVGGGFSRYSVDGFWRVPHFEKMLYDNAQLAVNYLEAYQAGRNPEMARVARETLDYVLRDMTHPKGGFFSAEDADSLPPELAAQGVPDEGHENKSEGAFYLWTAAEIEKILGKNAEMFAYRYGVKKDGNALEDPHNEFTGKNILYAEHTLEETAEKFKMSVRAASRTMHGDLARLLKERAKRPRPGLDNKVLASWNGLMLTAFARGYQVLEDPRYLKAAQKAAGFIRAHMYDAKNKRLYHRWADGEKNVMGQADDYAFLTQGLIDLYEASFEPEWLDWAIDLTETLQADFFDAGKGGYFMTAKDASPNLLTRIIESSDNVEPAASSVAALNLLRLGQMAHKEEYRKAAELTITRFGKQLAEQPFSFPQMLAAVDFMTAQPRQIILAGEREDPAMKEMLRVVHSAYNPARVLLVVEPGKIREKLSKRLPILKGMVPMDGKPTAYVCVNFACELPTNDIATVRKLLEKK